MSKRLFKSEILGFIFVSALGTLCHFAFDWSGRRLAVGIFTPVNESSWEHLKLLFFPFMLWGVLDFLFSKEKKCLAFSKLVGVLVGTATIITFFYTYTGIIGKSIDILNILSFFIGVLVAFFVDYILIRSGRLESKGLCVISIVITLAITALFALFTVMPPLLPLFKDPQTLTFGL